MSGRWRHCAGGAPAARGACDETPVAAHIKTRDVHIGVDVGVGKAKARVWTCDFSYDYVRINAEYHT